MQQRSAHKSVTILSLALGAVLLCGCGQLVSLPEKERYQYVDEVLAVLDYETAGAITDSAKDNGDGVFSASSKYVMYHDNHAFEELRERLQTHSMFVCEHGLETQILCKSDKTTIYVKRAEGQDSSKISLEVTDRQSGREVK